MIYYFSILLFTSISILNQIKVRKRDVEWLTILSVAYIIFIGGLRFEVGADWDPYKKLFYEAQNWIDVFQVRQEPLYMVTGYAIKMIFSNFSFFILIFFAFSFMFKFHIIKQYSPDIFLSIVVYIYTVFLIYDINGLRQGMAMGITLLSLPYILKRQLKWFLLLIGIASLFHISALVFLPFYYIATVRIDNKAILFLVIILIILVIPIRVLLKSSVIDILQNNISLKHYATYLNSKVYQTNTPILSMAVFQRFFIFILFIIQYNKIQVNNELKLLLRNGYFFGIIIFLFLSFSAEFASRLSFYYKGLEMIMIPMIVSSSLKIGNRLVYLFVFCAFCLIGAYRLLSIPNGYLLPYKNILFN